MHYVVELFWQNFLGYYSIMLKIPSESETKHTSIPSYLNYSHQARSPEAFVN